MSITPITPSTSAGPGPELAAVYPGPSYERRDDGTRVVPLGPDNRGGLSGYVAADPTGARCGLVTGGPCSGKSVLLGTVAAGLRSSGEWVVWFGDADPVVTTMPELVDWAEVGPAGLLAQLHALEAVLDARTQLLAGPSGPSAEQPSGRWEPDPALPGVMWVLDEMHLLVADQRWCSRHEFVSRLERVVRVGRGHGVAVLAGAGSLQVVEYGGSTVLRDELAGRNLFVGRGGTRPERAALGGHLVCPADLPRGGGYAYTAGSDGVPVVMRTAYCTDPRRWLPTRAGVALEPAAAAAVVPWRSHEADHMTTTDAAPAGRETPAVTRPRVVTLCGSMRFLDRMLVVATELTRAGEIVLAPFEVVAAAAQDGVRAREKARLDQLHRRKIDLSDAVVVVSDESGYYGASTRSEIAYATARGLPVSYRQVSGVGRAAPAAGDEHGDSVLQVAREVQAEVDGAGPSELTSEIGLYTLEEWASRLRALGGSRAA